MNSNNIILVTGGSGLVGKAIETITKQDDSYKDFKFIFLSRKDGDLSNYDDVKRIFDKYQPTYVIHLAALVGGLFMNMDNNLQFFRINMKINDNILELSSKSSVKKCVSCLSTCIFPDKTIYPIDESMIHLGPPHDSNYGYSYAKRMIDVLNKGYSSLNKDSLFTSVVPTNVYGPYDNFNLRDSHVIPGLIHKAYLAVEKAKESGSNIAELTVCGTGKPLRQFIYSLDLAKLILWVLFNYKEVDPIILSVDDKDEVSIGHAAKVITDSVGKHLNVQFKLTNDLTMADGQFKKTASNGKLRKYLPDFKFTSFEEGIDETVKWFSSNYENIRK